MAFTASSLLHSLREKNQALEEERMRTLPEGPLYLSKLSGLLFSLGNYPNLVRGCPSSEHALHWLPRMCPSYLFSA